MVQHPQVRLATLPGSFARDARRAQAADWLEAASPHGVVPVGDVGGGTRAFLARYADRSVPVLDPTGVVTGPEVLQVGDATVLVAGSESSLASAIETVDAGSAADGSPVPPIVLTHAVELSIDRTALSTTIQGLDALATRSPDVDSADRTASDHCPDSSALPVVLSTGLPAGYRNTTMGRRLLGIGKPDDPGDTGSRVVEIRPDRVLDRPIDTDRLGLEAIRGVGPHRASTLASAGFETRQQVAAAPLTALRDLDGLGVDTARSVQASATAMAAGRVIRQTRAALPASDPLFVDIETDGLHPSVTWLIGVLDGGPVTGTYRSFVARNPDDPGDAIERFLEWYLETGRDRTLVAYNGEGFDFPVLTDHLQAYRPSLVPGFEAAERFDPYAWAVEEGHALLPGRTDRLEDVAASLGHDPGDSGFTGAAVARTYRRWLQAPGPATEPPWDRIDAYCEEDVRALARVYEALDAEETTLATGSGASKAESTIQGTLSEW